MSYYNTTALTGQKLSKAREACTKQEKRILRIISQSGNLSPSEAYIIYNYVLGYGHKMDYAVAVRQLRLQKGAALDQSRDIALKHGEKIPITSIRRAMTNLTEKGYIFKTNHQRTSLYGKPEYIWEIKD